MKKRIAVIGAGTAGIISLCELLPYMTDNWDVYSIFDSNKPILGIGESTNPNFIMTLQDATRFQFADLDLLDGTLKFGTRYKRWREHDFVNPLFGAGYAVHFNNFELKEFAFERFYKFWPNKFKEMHGTVSEVIPGKKSAQIVIDGRTEEFDYIIDCMGFPNDYKDYNMSNCSPVNHCIVYSLPTGDYDQYTDHVAMNAGWMFGIPLQSRHTYGYLFNDVKSKREDIIEEMGEYLNTKLDPAQIKEYQFQSYYAKKAYEGRVLKNGTKAFFLEPLSASSIFFYIQNVKTFTDHLAAPDKFSEKYVNEMFEIYSENLEDLLSFFYHGGSTLNTEFWQHAKTLGQNRLKKSRMLSHVSDELKKNGAMGLLNEGPRWFFNPMSLRLVDENMGYDYFKITK